MRLSNGTVTYERRETTGDYQHHQASAVIHFTLDEGTAFDIANEFIARAGRLARERVADVLHPVPAASPVHVESRVDAAPEPAPAPAVEVVEVVAPAVEPVKKTRAKKAPAVEIISQTDVTIETSPLVLVDDGKSPVTVEADPIVDADFTEEDTISDVDLSNALSKKNAVLKNRQRIFDEVIWKFVPQPASYNTIPQDQRAKFLAALAALS